MHKRATSTAWRAIGSIGVIVASGLLFSLCAVSRGVAADETALIIAIRTRNLSRVSALIEHGVDVNAVAADGATALHWASHLNDVGTADALARAGADPNAVNTFGATPLSLACENGSAEMVELLLKAGANPNTARPGGETPLMTAARTGNVDAVAKLLAQGALPNTVEPFRGQSALMWAAWHTHVGVVQQLLAHGADIHLRSKAGYTPLLFAAREGDQATTEVLLSAGADINAAANDGMTALHLATLRRHADYVMFLLDRGANVNANGPGFTVLHFAAGTWNTWLNGSTFIAEGAYAPEWLPVGGFTGEEEKLRFVQMLLDRGADPNAVLTKSPPRFGNGAEGIDVIGATPFLLAAAAADTPVMRVLLAHGADPHTKTTLGTTAVMAGAGLGYVHGVSRMTEMQALDALKLAIDAGGDVRTTNSEGTSALHASAAWGSVVLTQFLLDHGADPNAANERGETPLMIAEGKVRTSNANTVHPEVANLLQKYGARPVLTAEPRPR